MAISVTVQGPPMLAPGQAAQYSAIATMSDNTTQNFTTANWSSGTAGVLTIAANGLATAVAPGDSFIFVNIFANAPGCTHCAAGMSVLVLAPNTYRLTGTVLESGLPVQGATITVLSGTGSGLSATTGYDGSYRLYGVAGALQIKMTKPGYVDIVKSFTATQNDVLDFPEARQTQPLPSLAGSYVLTLQADQGCTPQNPHQIPLPADMLQPRSYVVQVAQDGPALHVTGPAPTFLPPSDHFDGRVTPNSVTFELGNGYTGYGPDDGFTANLSSTQILSYEGEVTASRSGSTIAGLLNGELQLIDPTTHHEVGSCNAAFHTFAMSPAAAGAMR